MTGVSGGTDRRAWFVVLGARSWEDDAELDRRVVEALTERARVLWVDPPVSVTSPGAQQAAGSTDRVGDHVVRLRTTRLPGISGGFTALMVRGQVVTALAGLGIDPAATIVLSPQADFLADGGVRVFFVTDDWAGQAGRSVRRVTARMTELAQQADLVLTLSQHLGDVVRFLPEHAPTVRVVPGGAAMTGLAEVIETARVWRLVAAG